MSDANITSQLKDIKPLLEIPDISYYIYWSLVGLVIFAIVVALFFMVKKFWVKRAENLQKVYLQKLKEIEWKDAKSSAYNATHYARLLATTDRKKEIFSQLEPLLQMYKYKKEVDVVDEETLGKFKLFLQVADDSI